MRISQGCANVKRFKTKLSKLNKMCQKKIKKKFKAVENQIDA